MAVGIFAGIAIRDIKAALPWYQRLLGGEPTFFPNDVEAVWQLADNCHVYLIQDPERAGGGVNMIWFDDPTTEVARIANDGLEPVDTRSTTRSGSTSSTTKTVTRSGSVERLRRARESGRTRHPRVCGAAPRLGATWTSPSPPPSF